MPPTPVLVTRPEPGGSATARQLAAQGFAPWLAPLLHIRIFARALPAPEALRAILVASRQAIPALPELYHPLPLFAVGDATAAAARAAGFQRVESAAGSAEDLAELVISHLAPMGAPLLLATGENQGLHLKNRLQEAGFAVFSREEVYAAHSVTTLPEEAVRMLKGGEAGWVLLFSRETALCLKRLVLAQNLGPGLSRLGLAAISAPVAEAVQDLSWARIRVAMEPNEKAVLALLHD